MPRGSVKGIRHASRFRWAPWQDRFEANIDRTPGHGPWGDCHLWTGTIVGREGNRYGVIQIDGKTRRAHQVAWEIAHHRPFPRGMYGLHSCDIGLCVNPAHVRPGTQRENMQDAIARGWKPRFGPVKNRACGSRIGNSRLSESQVLAIRAAYPAQSRQELAARFAVNWNTIDRIVRRETWRHV